MKRTTVFKMLLFILLGYLPALGGLFTDTGTWYASLQKPAFNPPEWIFSPVWSILYLTIGLSFYFLYRGMHRFGWKIWGLVALHQFLNFMWTPAFFYLKSPLLALIVILLLLAVIAQFILLQARYSRRALHFFIPYSIWVCFAAVLNTSIWYLNSNQLS
ncbi:MAG: TspO/MBR family protein [Thermodesulfobacteriota bacterium]